MLVKSFFAQLFIWVSLFCAPVLSHSQLSETVIIIKSESKEIFRESGMLIEIADNVYHTKMDYIRQTITEELRKQIKSLTDQNTRSEVIQPGLWTYTEIAEINGKVFLKYHIPHNGIDFRITTGDITIVPGFGLDRSLDPSVYFTYHVTAVFEIYQNGSAESIRFGNPSWLIEPQMISTRNFLPLSLDKGDVEDWIKLFLGSSFRGIYIALNTITQNLNEYLTVRVKNNAALVKEFQLDETNELVVRPDASFANLVFHHGYSKIGYVKRNLETNPVVILEGPKSTTKPPAGTSINPNNVLKEPMSTNQGPKTNIPRRQQ